MKQTGLLSYGSLPAKQTLTGFFAEKSKPRFQELAEVFLQLRISERFGRGVTKIIDTYGKEVYQIEKDFIKVTIPFSFEKYFGSRITEQKSEQIKNAIVSEIRHNPNITTSQLMNLLGLGKMSIQNYLRELKNTRRIEHIGSKRKDNGKLLIKL